MNFTFSLKVKDRALEGVGSIGDTASSFSNSIRSCTNEVGRIVSEFTEVEELPKFVHRKCHPEQYQNVEAKVVHQTIDWSKYPKSSYTKPSEL